MKPIHTLLTTLLLAPLAALRAAEQPARPADVPVAQLREREEELRLLNEVPDANVFRRSPPTLRPHSLGGNPKASAGEAIADYEQKVLVRGQTGVTLQPKWDRWDDPTLFTDEDEYWLHSRITAEALRQKGAYAWIYDEPGYPSGTAGIRTLEGHAELQSRGVACVWADAGGGESAAIELPKGRFIKAFAAKTGADPTGRKGGDEIDGTSISVVEAAPVNGRLTYTGPVAPWRLMAFVEVPIYENSFTYDRRRSIASKGAHVRAATTTEWRDHRFAYPNLLDRRATERFIEVAYDPYARHVGDFLGSFYKAFFTDEPLIPRRDYFPNGLPPALPWYDALQDDFWRRWGYDVTAVLPSLFFRTGQEIQARCDFWALIGDSFAKNFVRPMTEWCRKHGVYFTGHFLYEEQLANNIACMGNFLAGAREMSMPGMDHLGGGFVGRSLMSTPVVGHTSSFGAIAPKLVSSAAHLGGWTRTMSESNGFSNPQVGTTFSEYVATSNWEMVLGVNTLPNYAMNWLGSTDEQRRGYSEHAGRVNYLTAGGTHVAAVAMLYPIAAAWANYNPKDGNLNGGRQRGWADPKMDRLQCIYEDSARSLLERQIDFDFVDEGDIETAAVENGRMRIGGETFQAVVLPGAAVLGLACARKLDEFVKAGGVVFAVDALPERSRRDEESEELKHLTAEWASSGGLRLVEDPAALAGLVAGAIQCDVTLDSRTTGVYVRHNRKYGRDIYFLVNNSTIDFKGTASFACTGQAQLWNPWTGGTYSLEGRRTGDRTEITLSVPGYTGCFIVFGADPEDAREPDDEMWNFGPRATTIADRVEWAQTWSQERSVGASSVRYHALERPTWKLLDPDRVFSFGSPNGKEVGAASVDVGPFVRPGLAYEGLESIHALKQGVYHIELEAMTKNIDLWSIVPRHFDADGREVRDSSWGYNNDKHNLTLPGPHGWTRVGLTFNVPESVVETRILLFPMCKVYFTQRSSLAVRDAALRRVEPVQPDARAGDRR